MNPLKKLALYPVVITVVIILITSCNWLVTAFFALIFDTTLHDVANSPIILLYAVSIIASIYMSVSACQYIDERF